MENTVHVSYKLMPHEIFDRDPRDDGSREKILPCRGPFPLNCTIFIENESQRQSICPNQTVPLPFHIIKRNYNLMRYMERWSYD